MANRLVWSKWMRLSKYQNASVYKVQSPLLLGIFLSSFFKAKYHLLLSYRSALKFENLKKRSILWLLIILRTQHRTPPSSPLGWETQGRKILSGFDHKRGLSWAASSKGSNKPKKPLSQVSAHYHHLLSVILQTSIAKSVSTRLHFPSSVTLWTQLGWADLFPSQQQQQQQQQHS